MDLHGVHRFLVTLKRTLAGQIILSRVRTNIWTTIQNICYQLYLFWSLVSNLRDGDGGRDIT